ncbi:hypothetical protein IW262DRAFT_1289827 [Armillaria fumosa]|nr:hypothetical protein IW262DRAFT_1289827 [Armillaria fumosa]
MVTLTKKSRSALSPSKVIPGSFHGESLLGWKGKDSAVPNDIHISDSSRRGSTAVCCAANLDFDRDDYRYQGVRYLVRPTNIFFLRLPRIVVMSPNSILGYLETGDFPTPLLGEQVLSLTGAGHGIDASTSVIFPQDTLWYWRSIIVNCFLGRIASLGSLADIAHICRQASKDSQRSVLILPKGLMKECHTVLKSLRNHTAAAIHIAGTPQDEGAWWWKESKAQAGKGTTT